MRIFPLLCLACFIGTFNSLSAQQTIRIRILNGHSGKAITQARVDIVGVKNFQASPLNASPISDGYIADIVDVTSIGLGNVTTSDHAWNQFRLCASGAKLNPAYPISEILAKGTVTPNECNTKIVVSPKAGEIVFFVQRLSLWQRLRGSIAD
jgi:hypothetical protein